MRIKESMRLAVGTEVRFYRGDMQRTAGGAFKSVICAYDAREPSITFDHIPADLVPGDIMRWADGAERLVIDVGGTAVVYSELVVPTFGDQ